LTSHQEAYSNSFCFGFFFPQSFCLFGFRNKSIRVFQEILFPTKHKEGLLFAPKELSLSLSLSLSQRESVSQSACFVKLLESNQMHPPDHILCDDNKLLDAQPTRRKKKKEQQQQEQVLGKQNSSFFLPSFFLPTALRIGNKDKNTDSDDPNFAPKTQRDDPHSTPKTSQTVSQFSSCSREFITTSTTSPPFFSPTPSFAPLLFSHVASFFFN